MAIEADSVFSAPPGLRAIRSRFVHVRFNLVSGFSYAARISFKVEHPYKELGLVLVAGAIHGGLYAWYLGLVTVKWRRYRAAHLMTGLTAFGIIIVHILTA